MNYSFMYVVVDIIYYVILSANCAFAVGDCVDRLELYWRWNVHPSLRLATTRGTAGYTPNQVVSRIDTW
jgi:hypothetical protein